MYGKKYMGVERTTFVIDKKGIVGKSSPRSRSTGIARPYSMQSRRASDWIATSRGTYRGSEATREEGRDHLLDEPRPLVLSLRGQSPQIRGRNREVQIPAHRGDG